MALRVRRLQDDRDSTPGIRPRPCFEDGKLEIVSGAVLDRCTAERAMPLHDRRRLQRVAGAFTAELTRRNSAQVGVDRTQEIVQRVVLSSLPAVKNLRDVRVLISHRSRLSARLLQGAHYPPVAGHLTPDAF